MKDLYIYIQFWIFWLRFVLSFGETISTLPTLFFTFLRNSKFSLIFIFVIMFKLIINVIAFRKKFLFIIIPTLLFYADDEGSTLVQKLINIYETDDTTSSNNISLNFLFSYQATSVKYFFSQSDKMSMIMLRTKKETENRLWYF